MTNLERICSVTGVLLVGVAAYMVSKDRKAMKQQGKSPSAPPVEELGEKLKEAWAEHHNA